MSVDLSKFNHYKRVAKLWGQEYWLCNSTDPDYCAKFLEIQPGYRCSLHCHHIKTETFIILQGKILLKMIGKDGYTSQLLLTEGEHVMVYPNEYHQFSSASVGEPALILEISSYHDDDDVYRLEDSSKIEC